MHPQPARSRRAVLLYNAKPHLEQLLASRIDWSDLRGSHDLRGARWLPPTPRSRGVGGPALRRGHPQHLGGNVHQSIIRLSTLPPTGTSRGATSPKRLAQVDAPAAL